MIKSKNDYLYYLECDRIAKGIQNTKGFKMYFKMCLIPDEIWEFQKVLRKLEYYKNCKKSIFYLPYRFYLTKKFNKLSTKLGFSIPTNVFGPGLSIAHRGTIVVNGAARIGANCRLHACVNIGTEAGFGNRAPLIGDNCYIGPGAKIYGKINIADSIAIGANSVVNKSFNESSIAIAGVPAKKIADIDVTKILINATEILDLNSNKK